MEKEQKQELGWRVSVLPIPRSCIPLYTVYMQHIMAHSGGMQEWVIQTRNLQQMDADDEVSVLLYNARPHHQRTTWTL